MVKRNQHRVESASGRVFQSGPHENGRWAVYDLDGVVQFYLPFRCVLPLLGYLVDAFEAGRQQGIDQSRVAMGRLIKQQMQPVIDALNDHD